MAAKDIRRNTLVVGAANVLARMTGLVREIAFAAAFGAGVSADAFNVAFRIGNLFRELFAEGALSNAFVPLFADTEQREGLDSAFALANAFLGVLLVAVSVVVLGTIVFAEPLVYVLASGYAEVEGKVELTAMLARVLAPFVATVSVASVFMGVLNVRGRFFVPALTPILFNVAIIAACAGSTWFAEATGQPAILLVALAALVGGFAQAAVQLPSLRKEGFRLKLRIAGHPGLSRLIKFIIPAIVAISVVQLHLLVEMQLASREGDGPVSWLLYAFRIAHLPFSIVSGAVAVSALAGLSVYAAQKDWVGFRENLAKAMNLNGFLLIPSAVGIYLLATPITALFYERGAFTPDDTAATAILLQMYAVALLSIGAQRILVPVFYTLDDPWTPMYAGIGSVVLKLPVALGLMHLIGLGGLPLSHAFLASGEVLILLVILERRVPGGVRAMALEHGKAVAAAAVMGAAVHYVADDVTSWTLLPICAAGGVIYLGVAHALGLREGRELLGRLLKRKKGLPPTIDPESRELLGRLALEPSGPVALRAGTLHIPIADGAIVIAADDGKLAAAWEIGAYGMAPSPKEIVVVMRVGAGPPSWVGLQIDGIGYRIEGEGLVEGRPSGLGLDPLTGAEVPIDAP
ncbi:MAG: murein biosynthesis integral membrane protein MurJ [Proteobacteria bacterium]|nr:murein biosynthesis integral membrane protein MurJ [Pseudomonadota bacterium]MCP4918928.1 murein biosynthesis integral membrane protein MurJ [Pseudomonadota bacterium]